MRVSGIADTPSQGFSWLKHNPLPWLIILLLTSTVVLPLFSLLGKSVENHDGDFIGLSNFITYFQSEGLVNSIAHSLLMGVVVTALVITLAFTYAYCLTHTKVPGKSLFRFLAMLPLLAPSLLPAIALVYLFGNQGIFKSWLFGETIYGPIGIIIGSVFWIFPHAFMIIYTALRQSDSRLYESARSLKASPIRTFFSVTIPNAKYGLISAALVSFTLVITDFGVPKVIGGQYNMLATDIYKQVVGQQNFQMGAVVSVVLLLPVILSFMTERYVQRRQTASVSSQSKPLEPKRHWPTDLKALMLLLPILGSVLLIIGMAVYGSFITYWPYNLDLSLNNYQFDLMDGGGWEAYYNSLQMAFWVALLGTSIVWVNAFLCEKTTMPALAVQIIKAVALVPMAVPGMVLGLSYIFFFNSPDNPLNSIYGTMMILVVCTVVHFYTVSHLTLMTALKQLDPELDRAAVSLKIGPVKRFFTLTSPLCLPAIADVFVYFFINAMTTVSAVVFLYSSKTMLASVAVMNMDDAGDLAPAAAMAVLIMVTCLGVKVVHWLFSGPLLRRLQPWRVS
ncbi:Fe3+ ABC transporter permease [Oleiphilus messinensis]|uniref:Fe3+ ABC transporter permease n=1 Tax=Oleiphilus messinensis TaxID=141451 RepID=A0A1Y0IEW3_9GAMM|nr:putative 2-aminoethylphosphonate ABC transporter permease subunit [Oleiphilus messinensis]ARU58015.1 Fe3+ ABC transporter permease [Oleiphilus messinensis]